MEQSTFTPLANGNKALVNMDMESDNSARKQGNPDRPWLFQPGKSGNPAGRPKGSKTLKTYVKEMLNDMTDEEKLEFLKGVDKKVLWEMAEGKAHQDVKVDAEITSKIISIDE